MANRLAKENSPYLLDHALNPVDWYPWGQESLETARIADKPIFLSIGYAACHWCHVMAHESFEDPDIASLMNAWFVNIKVDREERPDLDSIFMDAVVAITGNGGWPMSVFLTPGGQPFYGGTYFPPKRRNQMPSFREILVAVHKTWENDRAGIIASGNKITDYLLQTHKSVENSERDKHLDLDAVTLSLANSFDWKNGGWGSAPKFPQPMIIEFLLTRSSRGDTLAKDMSSNVLKAMAKGGMYDLVGGGFSRYSTDNDWLVPHFEKMLYDNAQLALTYLHAYLIFGDQEFRIVCEETLDFIAKELLHPDGGFFSSIDADSEGVEGKYYLWTPEDIYTALPDRQEAEIACYVYNITTDGNFEEHNVLQRKYSYKDIADHFNMALETIPQKMKSINENLNNLRATRTRPKTDDKVLTSWNALALQAFAEAARYLNRSDYTIMAIRNAAFLSHHLISNGQLHRSWRAGIARHNAYLEDYAALAVALISLYQVDPNTLWYQLAVQMAETFLTKFQDLSSAGFFDTGHDHENLFVRPKNQQDNAIPCGNSLAVMALLQLTEYTGNSQWLIPASETLAPMVSSIARYPTAFGYWLQCFDYYQNPTRQIALIGDLTTDAAKELISLVWSRYRPHTIFAAGCPPFSPQDPDLLKSRTMIDGNPTVFICENFVCNLPSDQPDIIRKLLDS